MAKVEVEGQELKISNSHGDQVIIPKHKAQWVKDLIKNKSYSEIDKYVSTLPLMSDYAADGTLFPAVKLKDKNDPRIQAYQDSLKLYNNYIKAKKLVLNTDVNSWESFNNLRDKAESLNPSSSPVSNPLYKGEKRFGKPETYYPKNKIINGYETVLHNYEKPVQPYVADEYKKPVQPVKLKDKNDPRIQAYQDSLDVYNKFNNLKKEIDATKQFPDKYTNYKTTFPVTGESTSILPKTKLEKFFTHPDADPHKYAQYNKGTEQRMDPIEVLKYPHADWYNPDAGVLPLYKKPVQPYVVDEFKDENLKNKTNNNRIGIDSKLTKTNKTVLYPEKPKQFVKPSYENFLKTVNPDFVGDDYNLKEAYENAGKDNVHTYKDMVNWASNPEKYHLKDVYKLPNHETFSTESKYYKPGMKAGKWEGDKYIPILAEPKKEQVSLIDSSQIKFPGSFSREIMPQEKGYDATKSKTVRYDRKGRIIKN